MKRSILLITSIILFAGCKKAEDQSSSVNIFPTDQPLSYAIKPTISCDTAPVGSEIALKHPNTGKDIKLVYKNSQEIDYLTSDWENRIPYTKDFFRQIIWGATLLMK